MKNFLGFNFSHFEICSIFGNFMCFGSKFSPVQLYIRVMIVLFSKKSIWQFRKILHTTFPFPSETEIGNRSKSLCWIEDVMKTMGDFAL